MRAAIVRWRALVGRRDGRIVRLRRVSSTIRDRSRPSARRRPTAAERRLEWAHYANRILLEHGVVSGSETYPARHQARYRAQRLIELMVALELHDRRSLREHTDRAQAGGWGWSVEYVIR